MPIHVGHVEFFRQDAFNAPTRVGHFEFFCLNTHSAYALTRAQFFGRQNGKGRLRVFLLTFGVLWTNIMVRFHSRYLLEFFNIALFHFIPTQINCSPFR